MTNYNTDAEKRIARKHIHDPQFIGVDGEGAFHFWSLTRQKVVVVEDGDGNLVEMADTPLQTLDDWMAHVKNKRGAWETNRVDAHIGETVSSATEVSA